MSNVIYDFEYNGVCLSDFDSIVCSFNGSSGIVTAQGTEISFQNYKANQSQRFKRTGISYDNVLTTTLQFCKNDCMGAVDKVYTQEEIRAIMRWLNEENYKVLKLINDTYTDIYFKAYANVRKMMLGNQCIGFEITFNMDSNFGYTDKKHRATIDASASKNFIKFDIDTDRESFVYPRLRIKVLQAGTLEIFADTEPNRKLVLNNCTLNEIIEIDCENRTITSTDKTHNLPHSFNFLYPRISCNYKQKSYVLNCNLNSSLDVYITEIRKIGVI